MKPIILAFSGKIFSGKTTLGRYTADLFGWEYASFGNYVRNVAKKQGLDINDRETLQNVGEKLISNGWDIFIQGFLSSTNWSLGKGLIIDGVRHNKALDLLKEYTHPMKIYLVFIQISKSDRKKRILSSNINSSTQNKYDQHSTEKEVPLLRKRADIIIRGSGNLASSFEMIQKKLEMFDNVG